MTEPDADAADPLAYLHAALDAAEAVAEAAAERESWMVLNREPRPAWYVQHWADPDVTAVVADPESSAFPVAVTVQGMDQADADARAEHIARHDPAAVLRRIVADRKLIADYELTVRLRDEAADRIKAAGETPSAADLDTWSRAHQEAAILADPVRYLAEGWGWTAAD